MDSKIRDKDEILVISEEKLYIGPPNNSIEIFYLIILVLFKDLVKWMSV